MINLHHSISLLANIRLTLLIESIPTRDVLILLLKIRHLATEIAQIYICLFLAHRTNDDVLDEIRIQTRI